MVRPFRGLKPTAAFVSSLREAVFMFTIPGYHPDAIKIAYEILLFVLPLVERSFDLIGRLLAHRGLSPLRGFVRFAERTPGFASLHLGLEFCRRFAAG